jgi:hypothetical protein
MKDPQYSQYSPDQMADDLTVAICTLDVVQQQGRLSPKLIDFVRHAKGRLGRIGRYIGAR